LSSLYLTGFLQPRILKDVDCRHSVVCRVWLLILDSERNDECIDFTMLCVCFFFLCLCTRERVEIILQFQTLGVVSDS
ncbi:Uncharacterized protein FWK35_00027883, partial [Aphis craccivora]